MEGNMPKDIYLIRHGQSTFNAIFDLNGVDPLHFDARLSPLGIAQVAATRPAASQIAPDLIVVSPLTRAIETAIGLFGDAPMMISSLHRERLEHSCDLGRAPAALAKEFPLLRFDDLEDPWCYDGEKTIEACPSSQNICSRSACPTSPVGYQRALNDRSLSSDTAHSFDI
jgi:glucosyl-3-phosphoglycerate phosphatase